MACGKKNARRENRLIIFADESALSQRPPVRRTWAPRGQTPIVREPYSCWKTLSMNAALAYRPDGTPLRLCFEIIAGAYDQEAILSFLTRLRREFRGRRITLIWDGLRAHRTTLIENFIQRCRGRLKIVRLPAYAPELNPTEFLWAHLKNGILANVVMPDVRDLCSLAARGIRRVKRRMTLLSSFARAAKAAF